ncbi:MAG: cytochrome P450, partial [Okeania sp. SIO2H7]|nr:cytochrome P450 [Okeania sp. SIO2H7]
KYGDMFTVKLGKQTAIMVQHPEAVKSIFTSKCLHSPGNENDNLFGFLVGDNSIFVQSGTRHQRSRQLLMPPFHGERIENYGELICKITKKTMAQWQIGQPFSIDAFMKKITLNVILQAVFGLSEGERYQKLKELLSIYLKTMTSPLGGLLMHLPFLRRDWGYWRVWGRVQQITSQIDELLYAEISDRRIQPDPERIDILSLLMSARDEDGEAMADVELRDQMMTLLIAGHKTSATALTWAFYWIHKHPEVQEKLLQELDSLSDNAQPMDIFRLPYLSAVCNETLRISPVLMVSLPRMALSTVEIMGYQFPPDIGFYVHIYLVHRREDLYPEPKQFKPERFLERQFSPFEFLPFGGGDRRCIGAALAQFEMKLVLATILSAVELELVDDKPVGIKGGGTVISS